MRSLFLIMLGCVLGGCVVRAEETKTYKSDLISDDQVYFFTLDGCSHCKAAKMYLAKKYPDLKLVENEISQPQNRTLFYACGAKFGLKQRSLGAPLFCIGQHYILGWDVKEEANFDEYIKPFLEK